MGWQQVPQMREGVMSTMTVELTPQASHHLHKWALLNGKQVPVWPRGANGMIHARVSKLAYEVWRTNKKYGESFSLFVIRAANGVMEQ